LVQEDGGLPQNEMKDVIAGLPVPQIFLITCCPWWFNG
jgi:hypothetical protein